MTKTFTAILGAALLMAPAAIAQDTSASPTYGSVRLSSGFPEDPHRVRLVAGGGEDASDLPGSCVGDIGDAPDYRLTFRADKGASPLIFRTLSNEDTTLVINGPDGRWRCDDDSYGDLDAEVVFNNPQSGVYDIWVGAFGGNPSATLLITEID
jgi:hypothetical protein